MSEKFWKKTATPYDHEHGWLSPSGKFIPVLYGDHTKKAFEILTEQYGIPEDDLDPCLENAYRRPDDVLLKKKWLKLHRKRFYGELVTDEFHATQSQLDVIFDYCQHNKLPMPEEFQVI